MPQFEYCHEHRVERAKKEFKTRIICSNQIKDGAGHYCKLIPMNKKKDYPHKYYRVFCYGNQNGLSCEGKIRA